MRPSLALPLGLSALWLLGGSLQPFGFVPTLTGVALVVAAVWLVGRAPSAATDAGRAPSVAPPSAATDADRVPSDATDGAGRASSRSDAGQLGATTGPGRWLFVLARLRPAAAATLGVAVAVVGLGLTHLVAWGLLAVWPAGQSELGRLSGLVMAEWPATLAFLATALIAVAEELLWRGLGARALSARFPGKPLVALAFGTLWYALCQAGLGAALPIVAALVLGAVTGLLRLWTGGLAAPVAMHLVWTLGVVWVVPP